MSELTAELRRIYEGLHSSFESFDSPELKGGLDKLERSANEVGKAWSHSWIGYQALVYYEGLQPPPPGANFSSEWGLSQAYSMGSRGSWVQFTDDGVTAEIRERAGNPNIAKAEKAAEEAARLFEHSQGEVISILRTAKGPREDQFLDKLLQETEALKVYTTVDFIRNMQPSGSLMSRDTLALTQGLCTPPHLHILAEILGIKAPIFACESLAKLARRAFSHLERTEQRIAKVERIGTNVCIGHGRSKEWKDLKDFIADRMRLPWDEFNRVPVAGIPNTVRLSAMLDAAAIAFLVLTGEDETSDGKKQARMNVIHEAGLFQGRLGFTKAIVMLEEGCEEFSNIEGLGHIRFPHSNIRAAFHDVQLVLEREGLVEALDSNR